MASFRAVLEIAGGGFETDLNSMVMDIHQHVDVLGRPASPTAGGQMTVSFNVSSNPLVREWMVEPAKQHGGSITFYGFHKEILKTIYFANAYCIGMSNDFDGTPSNAQMETTIVISPEKIKVGDIDHDNNWANIEAF